MTTVYNGFSYSMLMVLGNRSTGYLREGLRLYLLRFYPDNGRKNPPEAIKLWRPVGRSRWSSQQKLY